MRVLVIGAAGYVGSRLIPELLHAGHDVLAGARDTTKLSTLWWHDKVTPVEVDVLDANSARTAIDDSIDALVYLVHGMASDDFSSADHLAATNVTQAVDAARVARVIYVSGIIPDVADSELSEHLRSRLDVEQVLSTSSAVVVTLRAAMVFGGGSTSFELMRQLADRIPVTVVPEWMEHKVEPISIIDLTHAIVGSLHANVKTGHLDVGGGEPIPYPDLIHQYTELADIQRPQMTVGFLPEKLVAQIASWIADIPSATIKALMESLQHDMVAADASWRTVLLPDRYQLVSTADAITRGLTVADDLADEQRDPLQRWSSDPR